MKAWFFVPAVAFCCITSFAGSIPDVLESRNGSVRLDFRKVDPLVLEEGATISDAAEIASVAMEGYLRPDLESGKVSSRDLQLLEFCYYAQGFLARKLGDAFVTKMGNVNSAGIKAPPAPDSFYDIRPSGCSMKDRLEGLPFEMDRESSSFCACYDPNREKYLFMQPERISVALHDSRQGEQKAYQIALDPKSYGDYPQLKWGIDCGLWGVGAGAVALGTLGVVGGVGALYTGAAIFAWIPGPGWVIAGGCAVAAAGGAWWYNSHRADKWVDAVVLTNESVRDYIRRVGDRNEYIYGVFEDSEGAYQRAYMGLVEAEMLLENWRKDGWRGLGTVSDEVQWKFKSAADESRAWTRAALARLEDSCVNFPLMVDLMEASSICLYLNYLDVKAGKRTEGTKNDIRDYYLKNASKVGALGSVLGKYSTNPTSQAFISAYNNYFRQCYATNRVGLITAKRESEIESYRKECEKMAFRTEDEAWIDEALVDCKMRVEYADLLYGLQCMKNDRMLQEVSIALIGVDRVAAWIEEVDKRITSRYLYPSWNPECSLQKLPECSEEIIGLIHECENVDGVARTRILLRAAMKDDDEMACLDSFADVISSSDSIEEMCKDVASELNRRKLTEGIDDEIKRMFGTREKMASHWIKGVLLGGCPLEESSRAHLSDVKGRLKEELVPLWRQISSRGRYWWRVLF